MYNLVRKQNGEAFAKTIRDFDSGIFDIPDLDKIVAYAGKDANPLLGFLESLKNVQIQESKETLSPIELLDKAGYHAFVADTLEKQNSIQHYYAPGEAICTFRDLTRFRRYYIIHAVKKNVDEIHRSENPSREDDYGTSVISIQILKSGGFISIKNRYNHTVRNPDNTFNSNPDKIIEGLSDALRKFFNVDFSSQSVQLPEGFTFQNGQVFKYHYEMQNVYFGKGFYLKNAQVYPLDLNTQVVVEDFIIDLKKKKFFSPVIFYSRVKKILEREMEGKKWQVKKNKDGEKEFYANDTLVFKTKDERLTYINAQKISVLHSGSIVDLPKLKEFIAPHVTEVEQGNFLLCPNLTNVCLPELLSVHKNCFNSLEALGCIFLPKVQKVHNDCFSHLKEIKTIHLPEVKEVCDFVVFKCENLSEIIAPKLQQVGHNFVVSCPTIKTLDFPELLHVQERFCSDNQSLEIITCPELRTMGSDCFAILPKVQKIDLPSVEEIGRYSFYHSEGLTDVFLPNVRYVGENCFIGTPCLKNLVARDFNGKEDAFDHHPNYHHFTFLESKKLAEQPKVKKINAIHTKHLTK